jgi:hypothetical protein
MASHIAKKKKYTHFCTCSIHTGFEQLKLPASVVVEWVTDHIYLQVLIFHLLVIFSPQNKFNYFQSRTAKLPCMKGYCICIMTSTCTVWSGGGNFPVLVPITGQWRTAILQCSTLIILPFRTNHDSVGGMKLADESSTFWDYILYVWVPPPITVTFTLSQIFTAFEVSWQSTCIYAYGHSSCLQVPVICLYVGHL